MAEKRKAKVFIFRVLNDRVKVMKASSKRDNRTKHSVLDFYAT